MGRRASAAGRAAVQTVWGQADACLGREHRDTAFYAEQLCLASHYLSPLIREASGESPSTWITKAVISEAKVLLKQSDKTVLQISEELGFPNAPFFCRYFKRETGMTPSEYRES